MGPFKQKATLRLFLILLLGLLLQQVGVNAQGRDPILPEPARSKVEPLVLEQLAVANQADYFIWLDERADLSPAESLKTKAEKGRFVFETLRQTAEISQREIRLLLGQRGARYRPFYIANKILVYGGNHQLMEELALRPDVGRVTANRLYQLQEPVPAPASEASAAGIESNISFIRAAQVWSLGYDGSGIVLAGNDTGLDWDHPAIQDHYRGWDGAHVDHNHNWWDATRTYRRKPDDGHGHGTHTTGTMVGDDSSLNRIGVAPGAQTIHCKNMFDDGSGSDATFSECFEFDLAPWDLRGKNSDPGKAPDVVNNSWGYYGGQEPQFEDEVGALQAAGILVEVSAGNEGPDCNTLRSPADYPSVLTVGSVNHSAGPLPGLLSDFSSRGESLLDPLAFVPDVVAPGEAIRSSLPGGGYASWSGTSMAGPHASGLVALMWQANPALRGDIPGTIRAIADSAVPLRGQTGSNCGGDYERGPNQDWGHGTVDAYAAVQEAIALSKPFKVQVEPESQILCGGQPAHYTVDVLSLDASFSDPVGLDVTGHPAGSWADFSINPVIPEGSSVLTIDNTGGSSGAYSLAVSGTASAIVSGDSVELFLYADPPPAINLLAPADGTVDAPLVPTFSWQGDDSAQAYTLEVSSDLAFGNIVYSATVEGTSHTLGIALDELTAYYWRVQAGNVCGAGQVSAVFTFTTRQAPSVLLIDDDDYWTDVRSFYTETLDAMGQDYDIWDTVYSDDEPDAAYLASYRYVIWFTGGQYNGYAGPGAAGEAALADFLDHGGCLFLSSQDYQFNKGLTDFMRAYLGVASATDSVHQTSVSGAAGSVYAGLGPYDLSYPFGNLSDNISPDGTAELAFVGNQGDAAVSKSAQGYFTTFLGFPFEAIAGLPNRQDVLSAYFNACGAPSATIVDPPEGAILSGTYQVLVDATAEHPITTVELGIDGVYETITANFDGVYYYYDWDTATATEGSHTLQARVTDDQGQNNLPTITHVTVDNNTPPSASFSYECGDLDCSFDASGATDGDGTIQNYDWDFGDGAIGSGLLTSHTYAAAGVYTVTLTVTDDDDESDVSQQSVSAGAAPSMRVSAITMSGKKAGPNLSAAATVLVVDLSGNPISGAMVTGLWSGDYVGPVSGATDTSGSVTLNSGKVRQQTATFTFTIQGVVKEGYFYDSDNSQQSGTVTVP